ncbi:hypothetical protein C5167_002779 [Papaver somniferum]|uniref:Uncharacterized protein n=1 Tax=Papaver somniferum TaxID=3469 RepID=A0A4Y7L1T2_PAPSO|nr:hypothetical protein C5167_002779 [Papaver somniferum]
MENDNDVNDRVINVVDSALYKWDKLPKHFTSKLIKLSLNFLFSGKGSLLMGIEDRK